MGVGPRSSAKRVRLTFTAAVFRDAGRLSRTSLGDPRTAGSSNDVGGLAVVRGTEASSDQPPPCRDLVGTATVRAVYRCVPAAVALLVAGCAGGASSPPPAPPAAPN